MGHRSPDLGLGPRLSPTFMGVCRMRPAHEDLPPLTSVADDPAVLILHELAFRLCARLCDGRGHTAIDRRPILLPPLGVGRHTMTDDLAPAKLRFHPRLHEVPSSTAHGAARSPSTFRPVIHARCPMRGASRAVRRPSLVPPRSRSACL